ncbi:MAG: ECF-type sigma factor [Planctomycetota bacterium]
MSEPITDWIAGVGAKDPESEQALWNHYFHQVVRLARSRMLALQSTFYDEEDAAASALRSLFRGIQQQRFPNLHSHENLWALIVLITTRKLRAQWRRANSQKRSRHRIEGQPAELTLSEAISREPTPEFVTEMMDDVKHLIETLDSDVLRRVALMKMDGLTNDEIATTIGCTRRSVLRKLERIRDYWDGREI